MTKRSSRPQLAAVLVIVGALIAGLAWLGRGVSDANRLVVYCAHDEEFAAQILRDFERDTGIQVVVKYDTEATKSLGLVNLLIHERAHPQCDVFWNNELLGTVELARQELLVPYRGSGYHRIPDQYRDPDGLWAGFAARLRVVIINTDKLPAEAADSGEIERRMEGSADLSRVAIAKPMYGTTLTHYCVLWDAWGGERLQTWHRNTRQRGIREVAGNAATKNLVADGACDFGFTDTDDFFVARDEGKPVGKIPVRIAGQTICIPNSVAIIRGTRRLDAAQKLVDYLLSANTELKLSRSASRQVPLGPVNSGDLPEDVRPLAEWAREGTDLRPLLAARRAVLDWLKSEYLQ